MIWGYPYLWKHPYLLIVKLKSLHDLGFIFSAIVLSSRETVFWCILFYTLNTGERVNLPLISECFNPDSGDGVMSLSQMQLQIYIVDMKWLGINLWDFAFSNLQVQLHMFLICLQKTRFGFPFFSLRVFVNV